MTSPVPVDELCVRIREWLSRQDGMRDAVLYTADEWRSRQEPYGNEAAVVLAIDGTVLYHSANYGCPVEPFVDFKQLLLDLGYWAEFGFSWSINIYPEEDDG